MAIGPVLSCRNEGLRATGHELAKSFLLTQLRTSGTLASIIASSVERLYWPETREKRSYMIFASQNLGMSKYKKTDQLSTGQLFQFFQDGFDYTSTSGLRFSTVSGSLRLQFRLLASGPRFEKISALRAASSLKKKAL